MWKMCIRDSFKGVVQILRKAALVPQQQALHHPGTRAVQVVYPRGNRLARRVEQRKRSDCAGSRNACHAGACLLYTSRAFGDVLVKAPRLHLYGV